MTIDYIEKDLFNKKQIKSKKQTKPKKFKLNGFCLLNLNDLYKKYNLKPLSLKELVLFSLIYHLYDCDKFLLDDEILIKIRVNTNFSKNLILSLIQNLISKNFIEKQSMNDYYGLNIKLIQLNLPQIIFIEKEILCNKSLSFNERMILCYLKSYSDTYNKCIGKSETIARNLNVGIKSVKMRYK